MKWKKVGTGMTAREVGRPESEPELEAALGAMDREDWTFEERIGRPLEDYCERLLERKVRHGWPEDSPEGYARRALTLLRVRRTAAEKGNIDLASELAYELGELVTEAMMKARWERHALRGVKIVESARAGHETVHGTADEKRRRWDALQRACDDQHKKDPKMNWTGIARCVALKAGVSETTVKRRCENPKKK